MYIVVTEYERVSPMVIARDDLDQAIGWAKEQAAGGKRSTVYRHDPYATNCGVFSEVRSFEAVA